MICSKTELMSVRFQFKTIAQITTVTFLYLWHISTRLRKCWKYLLCLNKKITMLKIVGSGKFCIHPKKSLKGKIFIDMLLLLIWFVMCIAFWRKWLPSRGWAAAPLPDPVSFTGLVAAFNAPHMKVIRASTHQGGPSLPVLRTLSGSGPIYSRGRGG